MLHRIRTMSPIMRLKNRIQKRRVLNLVFARTIGVKIFPWTVFTFIDQTLSLKTRCHDAANISETATCCWTVYVGTVCSFEC